VSADAVLAKYISAINHDQFVADVQLHICSHHDYWMIHPLIARLFYIPATSAFVERAFSQGGNYHETSVFTVAMPANCSHLWSSASTVGLHNAAWHEFLFKFINIICYYPL